MTYFYGRSGGDREGSSSSFHGSRKSRSLYNERTINLRHDDSNSTGGDGSLSSRFRNIHEDRGRDGRSRRQERSSIGKVSNRDSGITRHRSGEISMEIDQGNTSPQQQRSSLRRRGERGGAATTIRGRRRGSFRLPSSRGRGGRGSRSTRGGRGSRSFREHVKPPPEPFGAGAISTTVTTDGSKSAAASSSQNVGRMSRSKLSKDMLDKDLDSFMLKDSKTGQAVLDADIEKYMNP